MSSVNKVSMPEFDVIERELDAVTTLCEKLGDHLTVIANNLGQLQKKPAAQWVANQNALVLKLVRDLLPRFYRMGDSHQRVSANFQTSGNQFYRLGGDVAQFAITLTCAEDD